MKYLFAALCFIIISSAAFAYTYPKELEQPWDHPTLSFFINRSFPPECDPAYVDDFYKSIEYWKNGGNGRLSFQPNFRDVENGGDVTVQWVRDLENVSEEVGGITNIVLVPNKRFVSAKIRLACLGKFYMISGDVAKEFSHREMKITSMHELGHALGLDHTDDLYDIMTKRQTIQLSPVGFDISSYNLNLNITPRRAMVGTSVKFSGNTSVNTNLEFVELSKKAGVQFYKRNVVTDSQGNFENSATFSETGRYFIEIYSTLSPNVFSSGLVMIEESAEVQVNSQLNSLIYLNGTFKGNRSVKLQELKYGDYKIVCKAPGYRDYETYITVMPDSGDVLKAEPSREAVLCANEKIEDKKEKGFIEKLSEAIREFFRILFS